MTNELCHRYQAPKPKKNSEAACIVSRSPRDTRLPVTPTSATPSRMLKNARHMIELENPKTDDCRASKTEEHDSFAFTSQMSLAEASSANLIRSTV